MQFPSFGKAAPFKAFLLAAGIFAVLLTGYEAVYGAHRFRALFHSASPQNQAPAGVDEAGFFMDDLRISGWAPAQAAIQIADHDKVLATAAADAKGRWKTSFAFEKRERDFRILAVSYQQKDKPAVAMGSIDLFSPGKSMDDAYIWREEPAAIDILQTPDANDGGDLFLAVAVARGGQDRIFAGRAAPDSLVQLYADNELTGAAAADDDGYWSMSVSWAAGKTSAALRFDQVDEAGNVAERRGYRLEWPENNAEGNEPVLMRSGRDGWIFSDPYADGRELVDVLKPAAGESMAAGDYIPGQIIPFPQSSKGISR